MESNGDKIYNIIYNIYKHNNIYIIFTYKINSYYKKQVNMTPQQKIHHTGRLKQKINLYYDTI